jgi:ABC-2 type transport system permease protein
MGQAERSLPTRVVSARVDLRQRFRDIWSYRELLAGLVRKELKVKYKNSLLGFLWSLLNPATSLIVYYVVFQIILKAGIPAFAIYLICGVIVWNLFSTALPAACGSIVGNSSIVKKVAFPREILALATVGAAMVHFCLQSIVLVIFLVGFQHGPAVAYLPLLIPAMIALVLISAGFGVLLAAVNVYLRDMQHLLEIALQVWFWATPIIYQYRLVADRVAAQHSAFLNAIFVLWRMNPVTPIVLTFQRAIYARPEPFGANHQRVAVLPAHAGPWWYLWQLLAVIGFGAVLLCAAMTVFGRLEGNFAEEL